MSGPYLRTASGIDFHFEAPDGAVRIEDIAASLAKVNRFNGHTRVPYSVAQHSIWVSVRISEVTHCPRLSMAGLLHDAAEAFLGDMPSPVQWLIFGKGRARAFVPSEWDHWHSRIASAIELQLMPPHYFRQWPKEAAEVITQADVMALRTEWRELMTGPEPANFAKIPVEPHPDRIFPFDNWQTAQEAFLIRFHDLMQLIKSEA
jgi:hypothetical protein